MHLFVLWPYCHLAVAPYFRHTSGLVCVLYLDSRSCFVGWGSRWNMLLLFGVFSLLEAIICSSLLQSWTLQNHNKPKKTTARNRSYKTKRGFRKSWKLTLSFLWLFWWTFYPTFALHTWTRRFGCHQGVLNVYPIPWPTRKCMWWREMGRSRILLNLVVRNWEICSCPLWWQIRIRFPHWGCILQHFTRLNRSWSIPDNLIPSIIPSIQQKPSSLTLPSLRSFQAMSHFCFSSRKWSLTTSQSASRTCARCELWQKNMSPKAVDLFVKTFIFV